MKILLVTTLILLTQCLFSQTGPGGIGNSSTNPLWLDAHTMGGVDEGNVSSWTDYSGNAANATEALISDQPTYQTGVLNGRDAIEFNGGELLTAGASAGMNGATFLNFYFVGEVDPSTVLSMPFSIDYGSLSTNNAWGGFWMQYGELNAYSRRTSPILKCPFNSISGLNVYQGQYNKSINTLSTFRNFSLDKDTIKTLRPSTSTHEGFWIGGTNSAGTQHYYWDGRIGEIFVFNFDLNTAQENILQNYLAAKYATPVTTDMYSFEGTYGLGVIGIGQEDASNSHTDSKGNGYVRINTPSSLTDGDYLFVGHDDVGILNTVSEVPVELGTGVRFERVWRAEKTGDLGTVTLIFDLDPTSDFSGSDPSAYRLLIDDDGDFSTIPGSPLSGIYNASENSVTFTGVSLSTGDYFTLGGNEPTEIHSIASGDWNETDTWDCGCIPNGLNNVFIEAFNTVTMDIDDGSCNNLVIEANGTLEMASSFELNLEGSLDIIGTVDLSNGVVAFTGSQEQYIDGGGETIEFNDITIDNTSGLDFVFYESDYILNGSLSPVTGAIVVENTGGAGLTVNSTSTTTGGRIGEIVPGSSISGNITVKRFLPAGPTDWRNLASPIKNGTFSMWDEAINISGDDFPDGCAIGTDDSCFHSILRWDIGVANPITSVGETIESGRGYEVYLGDDLVTFSGAILEVTGELNGISETFPTTGNNWNTMGNPYASPVLFSTVNRTHIANYFYVYDYTTGGYQWYDGSSNTSSIPSLANGLIAIGQGFWTFDFGSLNWDQSDKVDQSATLIKSSEKLDEAFYLVLKENASTYQSTISFQEHYECLDGFDTIRDVRHLTTGLERCPTVAIVTNEFLLQKNWISNSIRDKSFDLELDFKHNGYYTFTAANLENFANYRYVYLIDKELGNTVNLKQESNYVFYSGVDHNNRFKLILSNSESSLSEFVTSTSESYENTTITQMANLIQVESNEDFGNATVILFNTMGQEVGYNDYINIVNGTTNFIIPESFKGIYIITINNGQKIISKKVVL